MLIRARVELGQSGVSQFYLCICVAAQVFDCFHCSVLLVMYIYLIIIICLNQSVQLIMVC